MSNLADRLTQVKDIVAVENAKHLPHLLTDTNFTILSVEKYNDSRGTYNSVAHVEIDTRPGVDESIKGKDRYMRKRVPFNRLNVREAFKQAEFPFTKDGRVTVGAVSDVDAFIASVQDKIHFDKDELTFIAGDEKNATIKIKAGSLGYTGAVPVTTESGEVPETDPWVKEGDTFSGSYPSQSGTGESIDDGFKVRMDNYICIIPDNLEVPTKAKLLVEVGNRKQPLKEIVLQPDQMNIHEVVLDAQANTGEEVSIYLENKDGSFQLLIKKWPIFSPL